MRPLVSIVIANYNYGRFLEEAIRSVVSQSGDGVEIIVCDGGSTDDSVAVIKKFEEDISWWVSEPDKGQSNAFNKGFSHATGRFLTWLNADDVMLPGTIARLSRNVAAFPTCKWFAGGCLWLDPEMRVLRCVRASSFSEMRYRCGLVSVWGPSCFFSRDMFETVGGVDERFHYMMDSDLWLRFARLGYRYRPMSGYAYGLRLHPNAKMSGQNFAESDQRNPNHPKWAQIRLEEGWMHEGCTCERYSFLKRIFSLDVRANIANVIDGMRMKGDSYAGINYLG